MWAAGTGLAGVAALLLVSSAAIAREPVAASNGLSADARARELYLHGDRLYAEGSYDEAMLAFQQAYALSQRPALLFNVANALERLGRYEEALVQLNLYLPHAPERQHDVLVKRIHALEVRVEEQSQRTARSLPTSVARAARPRPPDANRARPSDPRPSAATLGYALGGAGIAGIGLGVAFGLSAARAREKAELRCVDDGAHVLCPASARGLISEQRDWALAADLAWGAGAAALGIGLYLVLADPPESGPSTELRSAVHSGGGEMTLVTRF